MGGKLSKSRGSNHYPQYVSTTSRSTSRYSSHPGAHDLPRATGRLQKKYSKIGDDYDSVEQVRYALGSSPCEVKSIHLVSLNYNLWNYGLVLSMHLTSFRTRSDVTHKEDPKFVVDRWTQEWYRVVYFTCMIPNLKWVIGLQSLWVFVCAQDGELIGPRISNKL